jgi:hypothetical protein
MENTERPAHHVPSRSRSRSRPRRSDNAPLHRILSSQFPDDHSVYHHEDGEGTHIDADASSLHKSETQRRDAESSSSDDEVDETKEELAAEAEAKKDEAAHRDETTYEEIKGGIPYEHDVEAQPPLEKKKSTTSVKDPNLVTWDSDNDPKNPKNCKCISSCPQKRSTNLRYRVNEAQMGCDFDCVMFHTRFANIVIHDRACLDLDICRIWHHQ